MNAPAPSVTPPLGVVLAGGAGSRLGGAKAVAELAGRPLISYPLQALAGAGIDSVVVAKSDSELPAVNVPILTEPDEPRHALAGIVTAMRHAGARAVLVLPCDAPFLSTMLLRVMAGARKTTAIRSAGRAHPLIALYAPDALARLEQAVEDGESATDALESLEPEWIETPEREAFNVNTPADLARAEEILTAPRS